jgi:hypothetical protein
MDMTFGTWNVRSLHRAGSLKTVVKGVRKVKDRLMGVQEVRWEKGGNERTEFRVFCLPACCLGM